MDLALAGDSRYTLEPADKADRGTTVTIKLKEDAAEFANAWRLEQIVKKHSDYVSFPIYLAGEDGEEKVINRRTALWRQSRAACRTRSTPSFTAS